MKPHEKTKEEKLIELLCKMVNREIDKVVVLRSEIEDLKERLKEIQNG